MYELINIKEKKDKRSKVQKFHTGIKEYLEKFGKCINSDTKYKLISSSKLDDNDRPIISKQRLVVEDICILKVRYSYMYIANKILITQKIRDYVKDTDEEINLTFTIINNTKCLTFKRTKDSKYKAEYNERAMKTLEENFDIENEKEVFKDRTIFEYDYNAIFSMVISIKSVSTYYTDKEDEKPWLVEKVIFNESNNKIAILIQKNGTDFIRKEFDYDEDDLMIENRIYINDNLYKKLRLIKSYKMVEDILEIYNCFIVDEYMGSEIPVSSKIIEDNLTKIKDKDIMIYQEINKYHNGIAVYNFIEENDIIETYGGSKVIHNKTTTIDKTGDEPEVINTETIDTYDSEGRKLTSAEVSKDKPTRIVAFNYNEENKVTGLLTNDSKTITTNTDEEDRPTEQVLEENYDANKVFKTYRDILNVVK